MVSDGDILDATDRSVIKSTTIRELMKVVEISASRGLKIRDSELSGFYSDGKCHPTLTWKGNQNSPHKSCDSLHSTHRRCVDKLRRHAPKVVTTLAGNT